MNNFNLNKGDHSDPDDGTCALEAVSILAGEAFSDHPVCVCRIISVFVRTLNDSLPDDETRNRLLLPLLPRLIGTRDPSNERVHVRARGFLAADYAVRVFAANALQAAGLPDTLSGLPEIVDKKTAIAAADAAYAANTVVAIASHAPNAARAAVLVVTYAAAAAVDAAVDADVTDAAHAYYIANAATDAACAASNAAAAVSIGRGIDASCAVHAVTDTAIGAAPVVSSTPQIMMEIIEKMIAM